MIARRGTPSTMLRMVPLPKGGRISPASSFRSSPPGGGGPHAVGWRGFFRAPTLLQIGAAA